MFLIHERLRHPWILRSPDIRKLAVALLFAGLPIGPVAGADDVAAHVGAYTMASRVDELLETQMAEQGVTPTPRATDAEFLRRASLDLNGVTPTVHRVRSFLNDGNSEKSQRLIEELLDSSRYASHLANTWRDILIPDGFQPGMANADNGMKQWLRTRFAENQRYDRIVGDFLTATGNTESGPVLFYQALETKPEKLAGRTARIFLGLQLECAECHDHPFDDWTQEDFWSYAAFFAQVRGDRSMRSFSLMDTTGGEVKIPDSDTEVAPRFPGESQPIEGVGSRRLQLSIWLASAENEFLARATVNRVWALMYGTGIVNPIDDMSELHPPSHPELLEELSTYFRESGFDLKNLFRVLANTRAYARSSRTLADQSVAAQHFAQTQLRALTADQLFDSISQALHLPAGELATGREQFVAQLKTTTRDATEYGAGIQQTLQLMNASPVSNATNSAFRGLLAAVDAPFFDEDGKLETVFLATLSRLPTPAESERLSVLFEAADAASEDEIKSRRADLVWALLNSAEFRLNH